MKDQLNDSVGEEEENSAAESDNKSDILIPLFSEHSTSATSTAMKLLTKSKLKATVNIPSNSPPFTAR